MSTHSVHDLLKKTTSFIYLTTPTSSPPDNEFMFLKVRGKRNGILLVEKRGFIESLRLHLGARDW